MINNKKFHSLGLVSVFLILLFIFISSTASATTEKSDSWVTQYAYISNSGGGAVSVVNTGTNNVTATVNGIYGPEGVAYSPDGKKVYVTSNYNYTVSVIDTATNKITATVEVDEHPFGIAVNSEGTKVYVTNRGSNTVSIIDTETNAVTDIVPVGNWPEGIAVNPNGTKVYVANRDSNTVSVIDTTKKAVIDTVSVGSAPQGVAASPDGSKVYVTNANGATVSVIDTATDTDIARVNVGSGPFGIVVNPDGTKVYVTNWYDYTVSVIDTATNTVTATVPVGINPIGVAVNPEGTKVYVANFESDTISVIDTATNTITATVPVGNGPEAFGKFIVSGPAPEPILPVANFSAKPTSGKAPLTVAFTDTSTEKPTKWKWTFGDGSSWTKQNPTHNYSKAGNYTISLTVTNAAGSNTLTKSNFIKVTSSTPKPVENFSATPTSGNIPLKVQFTDKSIGTPTSWEWSFGNGNTSTVKNPIYTYIKAGNYTVSLTVKNAAGSNTKTIKNYITVKTASVKPVAAFSAYPTSGKAPLTVKFTDKSTGSQTSWSWNFGDKSTSISQNPTHKYTKEGKYTVSLTVKNAAGSSTKTMSGYITVSKK